MTIDAELLERFHRGDERSFEELMRRHEDRIFAVCLRTLGNREDALDATQETFLTLYRKSRTFRGRSSLATWLYRVAVNVCYDRLRKGRRHPTVPLDDLTEPADTDTAAAFDTAELRPDVERALAELPPSFRIAVTLFDLEDLPLDEISQILDIPVGTVKSRIYRGRRLLADALRNFRAPADHPSDEDHA